MKNEIGTCTQFAPGMSLPQDVCENCGGNRYKDHAVGQRAAAMHTVFGASNPPAALTKDQRAQGVRSLGPFPMEIEYPCGCKASGGTGFEALPGYCPNHMAATGEVIAPLGDEALPTPPTMETVIAASPEPLYEFDGRRSFYEVDESGNMTGLLVAYPASAFDPTTGLLDQSQKIVIEDNSHAV